MKKKNKNNCNMKINYPKVHSAQTWRSQPLEATYNERSPARKKTNTNTTNISKHNLNKTKQPKNSCKRKPKNPSHVYRETKIKEKPIQSKANKKSQLIASNTLVARNRPRNKFLVAKSLPKVKKIYLHHRQTPPAQ